MRGKVNTSQLQKNTDLTQRMEAQSFQHQEEVRALSLEIAELHKGCNRAAVLNR